MSDGIAGLRILFPTNTDVELALIYKKYFLEDQSQSVIGRVGGHRWGNIAGS
jgi:hypothetical protein